MQPERAMIMLNQVSHLSLKGDFLHSLTEQPVPPSFEIDKIYIFLNQFFTRIGLSNPLVVIVIVFIQ